MSKVVSIVLFLTKQIALQTLTLPVVGSVMFSKEYDKHTCPFLLESDVSK